MIKIGDITSFVSCPRLAYFRMHHEKGIANEYHAVREIFLSLRKGYDYEWAYERFSTLYPDSKETFTLAASKFRYSEELEKIRPKAWEVYFESERLRLRGVVDEITESGRFLVVMLKKNSDRFTFKERMRMSAISAISGIKEGFVYYAYDGVLAEFKETRKDRYNLLRILEKLRKIEKGFLPERKESQRCEICEYSEECNTKPETFASRFF
ncbi:CRISPR-associated protein Cas4 [Geoglobus acetivorans]|uniref:CRISPR-associated RecB family exonuclease Cas4 n=1 Tax=Geoglobus acetivorans TaxID=565033 RepID=A0A0A7GGG7_GEOAI|nr:CRISPR-associated RecB family exonuclease Cas4 [Geoglobus acetivorans]